jgi:hypothetical protein
VASVVGGEPLEHRLAQWLLIIGAITRARGGHRSGRLGGAWPERSRGTGWSLEQSPMEIERERRGPE